MPFDNEQLVRFQVDPDMYADPGFSFIVEKLLSEKHGPATRPDAEDVCML